MRAVVALHEAFTFLYWNHHPLRKTECHHMTPMLPWQRRLLDQYDGAIANGNELPNSATDSYRRWSYPLGTPSG